MSKPSREYIYGINPIFEVVRAGRRTCYQAYINQATINSPRLAKLVTLLKKHDIPIEPVEKGRLFDLSRSKEHQGAVLKTKPYPYVPFHDQLQQPRLLLLDNVEDPTNVGSILRSAEIFGFRDVLLPLKGTPEVYPSVVKVSAGASEHLRICRSASANQYLRAALEKDFTVVALDGRGKETLDNLPLKDIDRLLLVIGGEDKAVGQFILNQAHHIVRIDMHGRINSLNASVAAGITMFWTNLNTQSGILQKTTHTTTGGQGD